MNELLFGFKWLFIAIGGGVYAALLLEEMKQYGLKRWKKMIISILTWWAVVWIVAVYL